jgi:hypothetical protein
VNGHGSILRINQRWISAGTPCVVQARKNATPRFGIRWIRPPLHSLSYAYTVSGAR